MAAPNPPQVTPEKAVESIRLAAEEIAKEDSMTFLTLIDVHLSFAKEFYTVEEQYTVVKAVSEILEEKPELIAEIAWDMVGSLVPFLDPTDDESEDEGHLYTVTRKTLLNLARYGNPREVVLKTTEILRLSSEQSGYSPRVPVLLQALSIVYPRIKTKFPSRFLAAMLPSIHSTYADCLDSLDEEGKADFTMTVLRFLEKIFPRGSKPPLPPRQGSSASVLSITDAKMKALSVADPEASGADAVPAEGDAAIQTKLIQSLLTHVLGEYVLSLTESTPFSFLLDDDEDFSEDEAPKVSLAGLSLTARLNEIWGEFPKGSKRTSFKERVAESASFQGREEVLTQILKTATAFSLSPATLLEAILAEPHVDVGDVDDDESDDIKPPSDPREVPLSVIGSILLLAALSVPELSASKGADAVEVFKDASLLPTHWEVFKRGLEEGGEAFFCSGHVDAVIALGMVIAKHGTAISPSTSDSRGLQEYIKALLSIAARESSIEIRQETLRLASMAFETYPISEHRLETLITLLKPHSPPQIREIGVGWYRNALLSNAPPAGAPDVIRNNPETFGRLVILLFLPNPAGEEDELEEGSEEAFAYSSGFFTASLNLLYLVLSREDLKTPLKAEEAIEEAEVLKDHVEPLHRQAQMLAVKADRSGEGVISPVLIVLDALDKVLPLLS